MTDINKTIWKKLLDSYSVQSDEQRRLFGDPWGACGASCTLEEARDNLYLEHYSSILTNISGATWTCIGPDFACRLDEAANSMLKKTKGSLVFLGKHCFDICRHFPLVSPPSSDVMEFLQPISASVFEKKRAQHLKKNPFNLWLKKEPIEKRISFSIGFVLSF